MTSSSQLPDLESGELVRGRISRKSSEGEGYVIGLNDYEDVVGIYATALDIADDTRVELCFVCFDEDRAILEPKSRLAKRLQLQNFACQEGGDDFSLIFHMSLPQSGSGTIDFNPPSDFSRALIELLAHWKLISKEQQLALSEELATGKWEVVGLLKRLDVLTPGELAAVDRARDLIRREKISWTDFQRAFYQELANGINFEDCPSIKARITS